VTTVLGPRIASKTQAETAWPALLAAMRRAENAGHDVTALLTEVTPYRGLRNVRSVSEVLALLIGKHVADQAPRRDPRSTSSDDARVTAVAVRPA
jgi:hypothetical protein